MITLEHVDQYSGEIIKLHIHTDRYANNNLAILATDDDGFPYCTISVNINKLPPDQFCYDYNNNGRILYEELIDAGLIEQTGKMIPSGYCWYPLCIWKGDK